MRDLFILAVGFLVGAIINFIYWGNIHIAGIHHIYFLMFPNIVFLKIKKTRFLGGVLLGINIVEVPFLFWQYALLPSFAVLLSFFSGILIKKEKVLIIGTVIYLILWGIVVASMI